MSVLVTGGAGYIGSHTTISLLDEGYEVIIADNFSNSDHETIKNIKKISGKTITLYECDLSVYNEVIPIFEENKIDSIIHFAAFKSVAESVNNPLSYYHNNLLITLNLLEACKIFGVLEFVFSSSATVYGFEDSPLNEKIKSLNATNPYGRTKIMSEEIIKDFANIDDKFSATILRYFNPAGAHQSGLIGEKPNGTPNNLMPYITQVANGKREKLKVFGSDYPTRDGTGIRDYIHVMDLAKGHVLALKNISLGINFYNLGTGKGTSVLELIQAFEKANKVKIPFEIVNRRKGDIPTSFADVSKARKELNWKTEYDIFQICKDAWRFEQKLNEQHKTK